MNKKMVCNKCLVRPNIQFHNKILRFKQVRLIPKIKGDTYKKVVKNGANVKAQIIIVKPKSIIQARKKLKQKVLKTSKNQANLIYIYKLKQNCFNNIKSKNVFYLNKKKNKILNTIILLIIGLVIGFVNGFWGGGGGMICVPTLTGVLRLPEKNAHATAILIMLPLSIASFIVYLTHGNVEWINAGYVTTGFVVGGVLGALLLKNINNLLLKIVFSLVIIAGAIKLLI